MSAVLNVWGAVFGTTSITPDRPGLRPAGNMSVGRMRLASEPIGVFMLALGNLAVGSAVQVQAADGTPLFNGTAAAQSMVIDLDVYAAGSPLNDLQVKVRKGSSAPFYQPWFTQVQAVAGAASIFVSQTPDE